MVLHEETVRPVVILFYILCNAMAFLLFMYPIMEEGMVKHQLLFKAAFFFQSWMIQLLALMTLVILQLQICIWGT